VARRRVDPKVEALAGSRTLNPHPEAVTDEQFGASAFFDARDLVQVKYEMVRQVRVEGVPVARAASAFGLSRPSYYQAAATLERDGLPGLVPAKPGPRGAHKLTDEVCQFAEELLAADASLRPAGLVEPLAKRFGLRVHPRSIERALARYRRRQTRKAGDLPKLESPRGQRGQPSQRHQR
jgi:transposase